MFIVIMFFFYSLPCGAETGKGASNESDNIEPKVRKSPGSLLSLDLGYALTGLLHQGGGIGLNYERALFDWLSVKGNAGHMTFLTGIDDVYCTSVNLSLFLFYYPFSGGLDKLYAGAGSGCDFLNYFGGGDVPSDAEDSLIHITPRIGWKFNAHRFLMIDVSAGYKFIISGSGNYDDIKNYVNSGFQFGINFLIFFNKIKKQNRDEKIDLTIP